MAELVVSEDNLKEFLPLSVSYKAWLTEPVLPLIQTKPPSLESVASKGPKASEVTVPVTEMLCELPELSVRELLPTQVSKVVPDIAVKSSVGGVKLEV